MKISHPYKTRIIAEAKIKTDCKDSEALADLVRANLIPEAYVPSSSAFSIRLRVFGTDGDGRVDLVEFTLTPY